MSNTYTLKVAGLTRELVKCSVNDKLDIAAFIMFSDVELTVETAKELCEKLPKCDAIITAECKGIPLAYEMSRQMGKKYYVARKSVKLYMKEPLKVDVQSITTEGKQVLFLDGSEAEEIKGKEIVIVDDVISTGESLNALVKLVEDAGGVVVGKCAVLAEGDAIGRDDIIYLEKLPLFFK